ncbi:FIST N-terminal domain-containing protein [Breoghania sp. L-A4]|uniref:FIST N-terminal domain-containing protein n=1 Tax=Breoghania sp. L-A4 TaxID=2304600 RepID=UPI000E35BBD0|nr:FIST N-terminal domain-containing protein [Breoghania sp. L-A4]AXS39742.1 FIST domain containing protein [Breoghania sp. L-A4]
MVARAWSQSRQPERIIAELMLGMRGCNPALITLFVSSNLPYEEILDALTKEYPGTKVVGCTTAGSLTATRYEADGAIAVGFDRSAFTFETCLLTNLRDYSMAGSGEAIEQVYFDLLRRLEPGRDNFFAMLLVDGLSRREEEIAASAYAALDEVPIFGASAGDNLNFDTTQIFYDGQVLEDSALVVIGASSRPVEVFKFEHFWPTDEKIVVTSADPERRIVWSINAEPAAAEYARMIGADLSQLTPELFAANPLLVRVGGEYHVRAIQKVGADGALHFFCAIDEGIVLTLAHPEDMRDNLVKNMARIDERLGSLEVVLCFDCILRRLEAERLGIKPDLLKIFERYNMIGFNTYGEQYRFLHLSQTLTGLAIGGPP